MHRAAHSTLLTFPPAKFAQELHETAKAIVSPGKGILAADESTGTIGQRFSKISLENNIDNRRAYRELLFTTPGLNQYISGIIFFEETLNQKTEAGIPFVDLLREKGIVIGIKVDKGIHPIPGTDDETFTQGLDGLGARCAEYYAKGARFAKWRAVLKINAKVGCPSDVAIAENARGLAMYGAICQQNGLVPIIEPEVLMDGDHSIEICAGVTQAVWEATIKAMQDLHVYFEGILLKPNMVTQGAQWRGTPNTPDDIAAATVRTFQRTIPPSIQGVTFLSGGQSEQEASQNLNAINQLAAKVHAPWKLTFSYGRALQSSTLKTWEGKKENVQAAQKALIKRCILNSQASQGKYEGEEGGEAMESLYVKDYKY